MSKNNTLKTKLIIMYSGLALMLTAVPTFAYINYWSSMGSEYADRAAEVAEMASRIVDGESVAQYLSIGTGTSYEIKAQALNAMKEVSGVYSLYVVAPVSSTEYIYLFNAYNQGEGRIIKSDIGQRQLFTDVKQIDVFKLLEADAGTTQISVTESKEGALASSSAVIRDSAGQAVALAVADIKLDKIQATLHNNTIIMLAVAALLVGLCFIAYMYFMRRLVFAPIDRIKSDIEGYCAKLDSGDLPEHYVDAETWGEFKALAYEFNNMVVGMSLYASRLTSRKKDEL